MRNKITEMKQQKQPNDSNLKIQSPSRSAGSSQASRKMNPDKPTPSPRQTKASMLRERMKEINKHHETQQQTGTLNSRSRVSSNHKPVAGNSSGSSSGGTPRKRLNRGVKSPKKSPSPAISSRVASTPTKSSRVPSTSTSTPTKTNKYGVKEKTPSLPRRNKNSNESKGNVGSVKRTPTKSSPRTSSIIRTDSKDGNGQKTTTSKHTSDTQILGHESRIPRQIPKTPNKLKNSENINRNIMQEGKNDSETIPIGPSKYNLHGHLETCSWEGLYHELETLANDPDEKLSRISAVSNTNGATALHTAVWKAPSGIALIMLKLLPRDDAASRHLLVKRDRDGNTPLHLLCANMMPYYDSSSKPILDTSVLELVIDIAPRALQLQNKEGDTPLHLFVTSPAVLSYSTITGPPSPDLISTVLKALKRILEQKSALTMQDISGATPLHSAIAAGTNESVLNALLEASPVACKMEDKRGMTPLHYVAALLKTPASFVTKMMSMYQYGLCHKSNDGDTPLHILVRNSADDITLGTRKGGKLLDRNAIQVLQILMGVYSAQDTRKTDDLNEDYDPFFITNNERLTPLH